MLTKRGERYKKGHSNSKVRYKLTTPWLDRNGQTDNNST